MMGLNCLIILISIRYLRLLRIYHKKHETLTTNPTFNIYINRIKNRLVFSIKGRYNLEL